MIGHNCWFVINPFPPATAHGKGSVPKKTREYNKFGTKGGGGMSDLNHYSNNQYSEKGGWAKINRNLYTAEN